MVVSSLDFPVRGPAHPRHDSHRKQRPCTRGGCRTSRNCPDNAWQAAARWHPSISGRRTSPIPCEHVCIGCVSDTDIPATWTLPAEPWPTLPHIGGGQPFCLFIVKGDAVVASKVKGAHKAFVNKVLDVFW